MALRLKAQRSQLGRRTYDKVQLGCICSFRNSARHANSSPTTTCQVVATSSIQLSTAAPQAEVLSEQTVATTEARINGKDTPFKWTEYWYPVHVLEQIDPSRPHAVELLGKQLVLWRDGQRHWQAMEDACPHRLAPLSEGRIEADGTLQCSYHGWRFNSRGQCTEIPQALDEKAKAVACSSSRSCVARYPVREEFGLIWVWPTAGAAAEQQAAASHLPVSKALHEAWAAGRKPNWYRRQLAYSWDILVENLADPSHLPFSHHNLFPGLTRASAKPLPFSAVQLPEGNSPEEIEARPSYCIAEQAPLAVYSYPSIHTHTGTVSFTPPCSVIYYTSAHFTQTELLAVPAGAGRAVVFTAGVFTKEIPKIKPLDILRTAMADVKQAAIVLARMMMQLEPRYKSHLRSNKLFDQDNMFLHMQDVKLAMRGKSNWSKDYYMPVSCDRAIIAARRWADAALQQHLPLVQKDRESMPLAADAISLSQQTATAAGQMTKQQINDRFNQHTKHCIICQTAVKKLQQKAATATTAAAALGATSVSWFAAVLMPKWMAGFWPSALPSITAAFSPNLAVGVAIGVGVGAILAAAAANQATRELEQFHYVEHSHSDNH